MKKTKVVCTMGPNTNDREVMRKLIQNGMDVARFNFSHGDHEEQKFRMDLRKELREEEHAHTAILLDTKILWEMKQKFLFLIKGLLRMYSREL